MLGGSWNRDGVILFGNNTGPLMRVSAAGGDPSPVTRVEQSRGDTYQSDPIFLPDGRHFLYFRHSDRPEIRASSWALWSRDPRHSPSDVFRLSISPPVSHRRARAARSASCSFAPRRARRPAFRHGPPRRHRRTRPHCRSGRNHPQPGVLLGLLRWRSDLPHWWQRHHSIHLV